MISGYGLWLPGDQRGSWSEAWDEQIGLIEPHMMHEGDPVRLRMARERVKHQPVRLPDDVIDLAVETITLCEIESPWRIAAGLSSRLICTC